ncbi:hypothetical protein IE077_001481 [Cardiosporidium cionae]|uniref:Nicalin n=1 Tax=Cardiosporidium cionae TaxID=476202 RepID=A0ABQ7JG53_9APIC|nr:hypothetical protein IE077_001481 [Cardiosporidium cionae]|eukprot:KAF8823006.1 hypothetical protein IE077_001481 [Cardiosporidium cionae]
MPRYRLLRYQKQGENLGCLRAALKGQVSVAAAHMNETRFRRSIYLVRATDLSVEFFAKLSKRSIGIVALLPWNLASAIETEYLEKQQEIIRKPAVSEIAPSELSADGNDPLSEEIDEAETFALTNFRSFFDYKMKKMREFERVAISQPLNFPIYFAWETTPLLNLYDVLSSRGRNFLLESQYTMIASISESGKIERLRGVNYMGWMASNQPDISRSSIPTIALVAHYDAFSSVPSLALGSEHSGSGLIAILEIIRLFSKIQALGHKSQYKLLFLLTSGASSNFQGTEQWLSKADPFLLDSLEYALCLDALGGEALHLHLSRLPRNAKAQQLVETLRHISERHGESFDLQVKKVKVNSPVVPWQHEQFSKHKVAGGTLSHLKEVSSPYARGSVFDYDASAPGKQEKLITHIKIIAEALAHHIFDITEPTMEIFSGSFEPSPPYVTAWQNALKNSSRFYPLMKKQSGFMKDLKATLFEYLPNIQSVEFVVDNELNVYYRDEAVQIKVNHVKNPLFNLVHLLANLLYLSILYLIITGGAIFREGIPWKSLFRAAPKKKSKTH